MQSIQKLKENVFSECQNYLREIANIESAEALLQHFESIAKLQEKVQFLKNLSEIEPFFDDENLQFLQDKNLELKQSEEANEKLKTEYWEILQLKDDEISQLSAKIKNFESSDSKEDDLTEEVSPKIPLENVFAKPSESEQKEILVSEDLADSEELGTVEEQIKMLHAKESEERRRKIVDFNKNERSDLEPLPIFEEFKKETATEKKFRLGKIKGLGIVKSLFDDDFLEEKESEPIHHNALHNSNMPTEFMEAEKQKLDFRIDLNDKVAFTKLLFKGDVDELKCTINQLNSYKTLDEAKEYLSELYYTKEWKNVDDYAQRLWVLVENKFI